MVNQHFLAKAVGLLSTAYVAACGVAWAADHMLQTVAADVKEQHKHNRQSKQTVV